MIENRFARAILSLVLAIALWAFVVGQIDPETKVTILNVPITFEGEATLNEQGLMIAEDSDTTVAVTVEGNRSVVRPLEAEDIQVTADVTSLQAGETVISLTVQSPRGTEITEVNPDHPTILIEDTNEDMPTVEPQP